MQLSVKIHLRMILPGRLHGEAHQVAAADLPELQGLRLLLLGLHHQQRDPQQDRPKQITQRFENLAEVGNHAVFCTIALSCARLLCFRKIARQRGPRVSEPACFVAAPNPGIFYPDPAPAPGERVHNVGIFFKLTTNCLKYVVTHVPVHHHIGHNLCLL